MRQYWRPEIVMRDIILLVGLSRKKTHPLRFVLYKFYGQA
jgi:hypothetical protein